MSPDDRVALRKLAEAATPILVKLAYGLTPQYAAQMALLNACSPATILSLLADADERDRLRAGIEDYLTGDYPNPRSHRPSNCEHGTPYYEECGACDCAHFMQLITITPEPTP